MWLVSAHVCSETLNLTSSKLVDLSLEIMKMIVEGYGLPKKYSSKIEEFKSSCHFRLMKYKVAENGEVCEAALLPHTDKSALTILFDNQVEGLQVLTKSNQWIPVKIPQEGFVVMVGDAFKVSIYLSIYRSVCVSVCLCVCYLSLYIYKDRTSLIQF